MLVEAECSGQDEYFDHTRLFITRLAVWSHNRASLTLPDVLTAWAGDGLRGMFLF
jgi:hypothetical protein